MASSEPAPLDPCCVETVAVCGIVTEFVQDWLKTRRSRRGQGYGKDLGPGYVEPFSAYSWLSFDTGVPETEIRKLRNPKRYPLTELRVADALVGSIGTPTMFRDGTMTIVPNPLASPEQSDECCSGSETVTVTASLSTFSVTPGMIVRAHAPRARR